MQCDDDVVDLIHNYFSHKSECVEINHSADDDNMNNEILVGLAHEKS